MICRRGIMLLEGSWKMIDSWIMFGMFVLGAFVWMVLGWLKGISETSVESEKGYEINDHPDPYFNENIDRSISIGPQLRRHQNQ